ncbi:AtpZ/AtpI family protein [Limobrevibacterium gyesilva]|uniref:AtpZ/AtpI family protein n=1 Tax=Limobrevibacterium gyesilva TaxID=2991712 RepID=A0AA42CF10_9PROT|nr:AtpZ/AtpI family protein [Limobrevibacterium gyesilva]MCW3476703.1 AtpZ/AtpI family protein [Limobrevibacterium gyesilva]
MSGERGGGKGSFEDRLASARRKQGLDAPPPGPEKSGSGGDLSPMGVGLRVGVEMVSALVVAVAIGWWLDKWLHTKPFLLALFVLLGGAAGIANVWRLMAPKRPPDGP